MLSFRTLLVVTVAIQLAIACGGDDDGDNPGSATTPDGGATNTDGGTSFDARTDASPASNDDAGSLAKDAQADAIDDADSNADANANADADADVDADADAAPEVDAGLPVPTGITAALGGSGSIFVRWTPVVHPDVVSYTLLYGQSADALTQQTTVPAAESVAQASAADGRTYFFAVRAMYTNDRIGGVSETISATSSGLPPVDLPAQPGIRYLVVGGDMGLSFQHLNVTAVDGTTYTDVNNATVTVNGVAIASTGTNGRYSGDLGLLLPQGSAVNLSITIGAEVVTATANGPAAPTITAPASGSVISRTTDFPVTWTVNPAQDPDSFYLNVDCTSSAPGFTLPGSARSVIISGHTLPAGESCKVNVLAHARGTFTGPARLESRMNLRQESTGSIPFTVGP